MRRSQRDFEDEIRSHLELETDRLIAEGMDPSEAVAAARRKFGNVGRAQEQYHDEGAWLWVEQLLLDVRYAARMLRKVRSSAGLQFSRWRSASGRTPRCSASSTPCSCDRS